MSKRYYMALLIPSIGRFVASFVIPTVHNHPKRILSTTRIGCYNNPTATAIMSSALRYPNGTPISSMLPQEDRGGKNDDNNNNTDHHKKQKKNDNNNNNDNNPKTLLSVASFNLLAPAYVRPIDKRTGEIQPFAMFEWVKDDALLDWENRKQRLLECLRSCEADVICLQELQLERRSYESTTKEEEEENNNNEEMMVLPDWIQPMVRKFGYEAFLPSQPALGRIAERNVRVLGVPDAAICCAVLVRTTNTSQWIPCKESFRKVTEESYDSTCVSVCLTHRQQQQQHDSSENNNNNDDNNYDKAKIRCDPIVVTSIHLDASDEKKRTTQLSQCLKRCRTLLHETAAATTTVTNKQEEEQHPSNKKHEFVSSSPLTTIIAGDFNTECSTGSAVACFLDGQKQQQATNEDMERECALSLRLPPGSHPSEDQLKEWNELHETVYQTIYDSCTSSLARIETGPTRCAYSHSEEGEEEGESSGGGSTVDTKQGGADENNGCTVPPTMSQWKLDHVVYTSDRLRPIAQWSALDDDPESCRTGLPNHKCPSDHLPLAIVFQVVVPEVRLLLEEKQTLSNRLRSLITEQKNALHELDSKTKQELETIQSRLAAEVGETNNDEEKKDTIPTKKAKKKKNKKQPPPKEVIECIRKNRVLTNNLRQEQQAERQELVKEWNDLERLVIQEEFGMSCREWVQQRL